ncbi:MAG TPA: ATP-binding protein [Coleofasciculaceae cyanobacterium]
MVISHFLIGPPSSGKSTVAKQLVQLIPSAQIVSTDTIRALLFGDERIQGEWSLIEKTAVQQIQNALSAGRPVIYDATNAKPEWRRAMLKLVSADNVQWVGWHLQTPLELCKTWNRKRLRQVPEPVIEEFFQSLRNFPPQVSEGFVAVNTLRGTAQGIEAEEIARQFTTTLQL